MEEIYEMLQHEQTRQVMGCKADDACLAEIAGALGGTFAYLGNEQADNYKSREYHISQGLEPGRVAAGSFDDLQISG